MWVTALIGLCLWIGVWQRRARVTPGRVGLDKSPDIRVLLFEKLTASRLTTQSPLVVRSLLDGAEAQFQRGVELDIAMLRGKIAVGEHVFVGDVEIMSKDDVVALDGAPYRGRAVLLPNEDGPAFRVVNILPMESYLAGVIGAEMPAYWDAQALRSQAIASRSYAMYHMHKHGPGRAYDVRATEGYQVYRGLNAESASVWAAINATRGIVLTDGDGDDGSAVIPAYFCSTCGGHTEAAWKVFSMSRVASLRGVACPWCRQTSRSSLYAWTMVRLDADDVWRRLLGRYPSLQRLDGLEAIETTEMSRHDAFVRLIKVDLVGRDGRRQWLEAENLRLAIDPSGRVLKSAAFTVRMEGTVFVFENGRGFGHGVGMCQYGALGMARDGKSAAEILAWYYPGARQVRLY